MFNGKEKDIYCGQVERAELKPCARFKYPQRSTYKLHKSPKMVMANGKERDPLRSQITEYICEQLWPASLRGRAFIKGNKDEIRSKSWNK